MTSGVVCGSCGIALRENARFCDECGSPTAATTDIATYRQVTVLFADVVRSMDLAATLDMERLREVMTDLVQRLAAVVRRYGGMAEHTGDGVMAIFGAPVALEDHAFRACLAALAIQDEATRLAADVQQRDGVALQLRVGLNSGQVIAGEIGSGTLGYTATGETVGFAQRMESAAPPGGVLLSEATARLVEHLVTLTEPELVHIKGVDEPACARRLLAIGPPDLRTGRAEASLVGRRWEMAALDALIDRAIGGHGGVVTVVGPPGIGKSRVAREAAALAAGRGVEVVSTFCESHAREVPFHAVTRLLRTGIGVADLDGDAARARVRAWTPDADPEDLLLLDDLLGIADPEVPLPNIDPDARRRRVTALINTATLARTTPALIIIEDVHWIDAISESMLADFLANIPQTSSLVLITARPEYAGALARTAGGQTITLAPLGDSDTTTMLGELMGSDPSVTDLAAFIAERAAGNPFFAEEMVRELVQRGVLEGEPGDHICRVDVNEVSVPASVQAAIEARIDRLTTRGKRTLNAASVIGARFDADLLAALDIDAVLDELLSVELIDQVRYTPHAEYAFHHPLIRTVAYESQLKSDRAEWHRLLATAIERGEPDKVDQNAALIAEHLQAAGEPHTAYAWHMRAGASSTTRDIRAARLSWERARRIADALPADHPNQLSMRIAPRTMLCATDAYGLADGLSQGRFPELQELCGAAGDKLSVIIGMTGPGAGLLYAGRVREASRLVAEQMALVESIDDPTPIMAMVTAACAIWFESGEFGEMLRFSQKVIDLADGDPTKGATLGIESPLAIGLTWRGVARWWLGRPGWRRDLHDAVAMARSSGPTTLALVVIWSYSFAIYYGVLLADDSTVPAVEEAVRMAEASSTDVAVSLAKFALGATLLSREVAADRRRGIELMAEVRDTWLRRQVAQQDIPVTELWVARESAMCDDRDGAIPVMRKVVDNLHQAGRLGYGVWATGVLVETLLERGTDGDVAEAQEATDRLANFRADEDSAIRDITLLRLNTLLARARGDDVAYLDLKGRYRAMAESLGYEGHIVWAEAM